MNPLSGLLAYFKFDTNSDSSVNGITGVNTNISYVPGKRGNSASFNGSTSRIQSSLNHPLAASEGFTVCGWYRYGGLNTGGNANQLIISNYQILPIPYNIYLWDANGSFAALSRDNAAAHIALLIGTTPVNDGEWHWFCYGRDAANFYLYIDNVLEDTVPYSLWNPITVSNNMIFGLLNVFFSESYLNGDIDDVGIWNRLLTTAERTRVFRTTYPFSSNNFLKMF